MNGRLASKLTLSAELQHQGVSVVSAEALTILQTKSIHLQLNMIDTDEAAAAKNPTLVLLHGNSSSLKAWFSTIEYFEATYRVIAIDLLGHGESTKICELENVTESEKEILSAQFYSPLAMVKQIEQVFQARSIIGAHVIGWSLGGHLAYAIAADMPVYISKILSIGSPPVRISLNGFQQGFHAWFATTLIKEWVTNPVKFSRDAATTIAGSMKADSDEDLIHDLMTTDQQVRKYLFVNYQDYDKSFYDVLDAKKWITCTDIALCLMVGEDDKGINPEFIRSFSGKFTNQTSHIQVIKDHGHMVFRTDESVFFRNASRFFSAPSSRDIVLNGNEFVRELVIHNPHGGIYINDVKVTQGGIFARGANVEVRGCLTKSGVTSFNIAEEEGEAKNAVPSESRTY